jgi:outer membrane immunogenic protein
MKFRVAAALLASSVTAASAADLPSAAPAPYQKAPYIAPVYNWTGFYLGAMGGYGWSQSVNIAGIGGNTSDIKGGFGGGTIGYNWQGAGSPIVFGVEADAAWSDINYSTPVFGVTFQDKIQSFGSVTGRLGYAADAALLYAKGGYAWADNQISLSALGVSLAQSQFHSGWTVGGGLEYGFTRNWSGKIEYMYSSYASENYLSAFAPGGIGFSFDVNTVKAGLN